MYNIIHVGNFGRSWDSSLCDELHISNALKALGHEVYNAQRETMELPEIKPDFILMAQWNGYPRHVCKMLKEKYKCPVIYFCYDYQFDSQEDWHFEMAKEADLFLSKEMNNRKFYENIGANFYWLPQDFAPEFLKPTDKNVEGIEVVGDDTDIKEVDVGKEYEVVFTGSYLPQAVFRNECLKAVDDQFNLHIFTVTPDGFKDFKNVHPAILDEGLPELYAKAKLNLSVDCIVDAEGYWSDRLSQILACGSRVINKYIPMQEIIYPDVTHFNTIKECLELIKKGAGDTDQKPIYVKDRIRQLLNIVRYKLL